MYPLTFVYLGGVQLLVSFLPPWPLLNVYPAFPWAAQSVDISRKPIPMLCLTVHLRLKFGMATSLIGAQFRTLADYLDNTRHSLDEDRFGDSLSVMQECWNVRNHFIFQNLMSLGQRAIDFVNSYRQIHQNEAALRQ